MYMEKNPLFAALTINPSSAMGARKDQYHHQSADGGGGGEGGQGLDCGNSNSNNNSKSVTDACPDCHGAGYLADNQPCLMCPGPSISSMPLPSRSRIYTLMQSRDHYQLDSSSSSSFMAPSSLAATPRSSSSRSSSRHHHRRSSPTSSSSSSSSPLAYLKSQISPRPSFQYTINNKPVSSHQAFFDIDSDHDGDVEDHDDGDVSDTACPGSLLQATSTASTARGRSRVSRKSKGNHHTHLHGLGGIVEA